VGQAEELGSLEGGKSTAIVRDCWFSKCGKNAVVRRPARRVKCEGDRKTERRQDGDREDSLKGSWCSRRTPKIVFVTLTSRRGSAGDIGLSNAEKKWRISEAYFAAGIVQHWPSTLQHQPTILLLLPPLWPGSDRSPILLSRVQPRVSR
jgi:hypothetical protein